MASSPAPPILLIVTVILAGCAGLTEPSISRQDDHNQWGRHSNRNNLCIAPDLDRRIPTRWQVGDFTDDGLWQRDRSQNVKWVARLGSNAFGNAVVAGGRVYVGTNNDAGYLPRFPKGKVDLGVLLCFDARDGKFLWQYSAAKLPGGDKHDYAGVGICGSPYVEGSRVWLVNNRGEVVSLDSDDVAAHEPAVLSTYDMRKELGVAPLFMSNCSPTAWGNKLLVCTCNGTDESGKHVLAPHAPSFIALEMKADHGLRRDRGLRWRDASPGGGILHGQWSSPAIWSPQGASRGTTLDQVIFAGGDGWLYGFAIPPDFGDAWDAKTSPSKPALRWRFDCNAKDAVWKAGGRGNRNTLIATPVVHGDCVYIATGQSPEWGDGPGTLWCVDLKRATLEGGDVSPDLVFNPAHDAGRSPIPPRREQAADAAAGDIVKPNPNSAAVWKYTGDDLNGNGRIDLDERFHRSISTVAAHNGLVIAPDFSGIVHCVDAATGKAHWTHDLQAGVWGSPLIFNDRVYLGTDDGRVVVFALSRQKKVLAENDMGESVYSTPMVANGMMYVATKSRLFAITSDARP
jgi:outer membrane protein assembly factor BamB